MSLLSLSSSPPLRGTMRKVVLRTLWNSIISDGALVVKNWINTGLSTVDSWAHSWLGKGGGPAGSGSLETEDEVRKAAPRSSMEHQGWRLSFTNNTAPITGNTGQNQSGLWPTVREFGFLLPQLKKKNKTVGSWEINSLAGNLLQQLSPQWSWFTNWGKSSH
jgi:hypothetical protein